MEILSEKFKVAIDIPCKTIKINKIAKISKMLIDRKSFYEFIKEDFRRLAFTLFSGKRSIRVCNKRNVIIWDLLLDPDSKIDHIISVMKSNLTCRKDVWKEMDLKDRLESQNDHDLVLEIEDSLKSIDEKNRINDVQWAQNFVNPETYVWISHGGTLGFINEFLANENQGYAASGEYKGFGIEVTPSAFLVKKNCLSCFPILIQKLWNLC